MNDADFTRAADAALDRLCAALDASGIECDWELKEGGVLEIELEDGSRIIVNRHAAAKEIWVAARSGGYHFRYDGRGWLDTRDGAELFESLSQRLSEQSGQAVALNAGPG